MNNSTYLRNLALELRWRRIPDSEVVDILREVASEATSDGQDLRSRIGTPDAYASTFPRAKAWPVGYLVTTIGVLLAVILVGVRVFTSLALDLYPGLGLSLAIYGAAVVVVVAAVMIGRQLDQRLPEGLTDGH